MTGAESLPQRLADDLTARGDLTPPWREAFSAMARHAFIPDTIWRDDGDVLAPLRREDNPQAWLDAAYAHDAVITQVDDGHPAGPGQTGRYITSSASNPGVVALMLDALAVEPGMRVCEIGTGTGYNAALLAHRLGATNVTTIEIDPHTAEHARQALTAAGYAAVTVITGDGAVGYPPHKPYDRVIATAAVQRIPYPWVSQSRPGGKILTPWGTPYHNGALVRLTVSDDGSAHGRIVGNVAFMYMRNERVRATVDDQECDETTARTSHTHVEPYHVAGNYDASLAIGMKVPGCSNIFVPPDDDSGECRLWFVDPSSKSWANLHYQPDAHHYAVHQAGPRNLWDEVEAAYHWWCDAGSPTADRWRITVTPSGQHVSLAENTGAASS